MPPTLYGSAMLGSVRFWGRSREERFQFDRLLGERGSIAALRAIRFERPYTRGRRVCRLRIDLFRWKGLRKRWK
jgi:hypothetical protein